MPNLIIIGDGGHKKVVLDVAHQLGYTLVGIMDDAITTPVEENGIKKINRKYLKALIDETGAKLFFGIGNNPVREKIVLECQLSDDDFATLISPNAFISPSVKVGVGTLVMPRVVINSDAVIGKHVILNSGCIVEHDCCVDDYAHISPGAVLTGGVSVGRLTQIGANAVVNPLIRVGANVTVGSGASVISNIDSNKVAVGVPAKQIKTKE